MQLKLKADILLNVQGDRELTDDEKNTMILMVEQKLNGIEVVTLTAVPMLMVGVRVHIKSEA